jgi:WD40 repeat protein
LTLPEGTLFEIEGSTGAAVSDDGTRLAVSLYEQEVRLFDALTGQQEMRLRASNQTSKIRNFLFSPDGSTIAAIMEDGSVQLWDSETGEDRGVLETRMASAMNLATYEDYNPEGASAAFTPDGSLLAIDTGTGLIVVWDVATASHVATFGGYPDYISDMAFNSDGSQLAVGLRDGTVFTMRMVP